MIISQQHKFIFIHVPKTAGGSVRQALIRSANASKPGGYHQHVPATTARNLNPEQFEKFFVFAFVRNPWARMWSLYNFNLERKGKGHQDVGQCFDDYLNNERVHKWTKTFPNPKTPIQQRPQTEWILDKDGKQIVDFVGKYENLRKDLAMACILIGIPVPQLTRTHKTSNTTPYTEAYSPEGRELVAEYFKSDIDMFGYTFCGPDHRRHR